MEDLWLKTYLFVLHKQVKRRRKLAQGVSSGMEIGDIWDDDHTKHFKESVIREVEIVEGRKRQQKRPHIFMIIKFLYRKKLKRQCKKVKARFLCLFVCKLFVVLFFSLQHLLSSVANIQLVRTIESNKQRRKGEGLLLGECRGRKLRDFRVTMMTSRR